MRIDYNVIWTFSYLSWFKLLSCSLINFIPYWVFSQSLYDYVYYLLTFIAFPTAHTHNSLNLKLLFKSLFQSSFCLSKAKERERDVYKCLIFYCFAAGIEYLTTILSRRVINTLKVNLEFNVEHFEHPQSSIPARAPFLCIFVVMEL